MSIATLLVWAMFLHRRPRDIRISLNQWNRLDFRYTLLNPDQYDRYGRPAFSTTSPLITGDLIDDLTLTYEPHESRSAARLDLTIASDWAIDRVPSMASVPLNRILASPKTIYGGSLLPGTVRLRPTAISPFLLCGMGCVEPLSVELAFADSGTLSLQENTALGVPVLFRHVVPVTSGSVACEIVSTSDLALTINPQLHDVISLVVDKTLSWTANGDVSWNITDRLVESHNYRPRFNMTPQHFALLNSVAKRQAAAGKYVRAGELRIDIPRDGTALQLRRSATGPAPLIGLQVSDTETLDAVELGTLASIRLKDCQGLIQGLIGSGMYMSAVRALPLEGEFQVSAGDIRGLHNGDTFGASGGRLYVQPDGRSGVILTGEMRNIVFNGEMLSGTL
jgi:hypothetical protein